jgi:hypothetical protein
LLQDKFNTNEVITIKLTSGEEVIGYYVEHDHLGITLRKPVVLVTTGDGHIGLAPYLMSSNYLQSGDNINFSATGVIATVKTNKQFSDTFTQQMSGLNLSSTARQGLIT